MELKKSVIFSIGDIQQAVALIAKQQGVITRELTQSELKEIVEAGSLSVEMEYLDVKPLIPTTTNLLPHEFFINASGRVQGLSVFVQNVEESILYKYLIPIVEATAGKEALIEFYNMRSSNPHLRPIDAYGKDWKKKWEFIGGLFVSIGQQLVMRLQAELRNGSDSIKGTKAFNKDSVITNVKMELGFSQRLSVHLTWRLLRGTDQKSFVLGEKINKQMLPNILRERNMGKKVLMEVEDFILLYNL